MVHQCKGLTIPDKTGVSTNENKLFKEEHHDDLLFNIADDPSERVNLVADPAYVSIVEQFRKRLLGRYDVEDVTWRAAESKRTRSFLHEALSTNDGYAWDYQPEFDARQQYVRGVNKPSTV